MQLHGYFRSSASYRVRIALNLKKIDYEQVSVHLIKDGGQQFSESFKAINPESLVPVLVDEHNGHEVAISQSLAILEYLEEKYPSVPILPKDFSDRAYVRSLSLSIACDIHPINNLRVLKYLSANFAATEEQKNTWYRHWCEKGLRVIEERLATNRQRGDFCFGNQVTMADCCLIPQIFNAQRFQCDLSEMPNLMEINQRCLELDAFRRATPANQPDAE
ncbi:maleylacetoacetate isomerase [Undibacterium fentianense]|uniref:Maleylacetoacetate isomerase n=1 Tax=Undibacterium fentianense TaxID=2828728 RepID=A0A941E2H8_9BURK|nr:maleylacetoacetate isomerase [Undibacterium fentianense]MBR7800032.1 maleylacetoacetate isomerase [Undibacterium fentianense]